MKALTVKQPYATLIMSGVKLYEMRSWQPREPGLLAIHAAANPMPVVDLLNIGLDTKHWNNLWQPLGYVLGTVHIIEVIDTQTLSFDELRHWDNGLHPITFQGKDFRYAWKLEVVERFLQPVHATGKLGLWNWEAQTA